MDATRMADDTFDALKPLSRTTSTRYRLLAAEARRARQSEAFLLETLKDVARDLGDLMRHGSSEPNRQQAEQAFLAIRAAIAKTEGK